jgi:hypothetical protein
MSSLFEGVDFMKKLLSIFLVLILVLSLAACDEQESKNNKPDIILPTIEPSDGSVNDREVQFDDSTNFSYISFKAGYNTRPYFKSNAEFPENMFIYETITPHIGDIKKYGYMNEKFEKLSEPISLSPNIFTMGMAMIDSEEGSYIVNSDFKNMVELCDGYALVDNGIVKVSWRNEVPEHITVLTITDPDSYLVPVKVDTGRLSDDGKVYIYGYMTATEVLTGNATDKDAFIISPVFEDARPFFNGLAAAKSEGLWGYIDQNGNTVIDFLYNDVRDFNDTAAFVYEGNMKTYQYSESRTEEVFEGYWALIDMEGNLLTEFNIRNPNEFHDGWAVVQYAERRAVSEYNSNFDTGKSLSNYVNLDGENYFNTSMKYILLYPFIDGIAIRQEASGCRFYKSNGELLFNKTFLGARNFSDGLAAVKLYSSIQSWSYIDYNGNVAFKEKYIAVNDFSNGFAFVVDGFNKPGYVIDKLGNKYLEDLNLYGMTKFNDEGYALGYTIIDKNESNQEWLYYMIHIESN